MTKKRKPGRPLKYSFDQIKPGKSKVYQPDNYHGFRNAAYYYAKAHNIKLSVYKLPEGIRVYRLK